MGTKMKAEISVKLLPWGAPNFARLNAIPDNRHAGDVDRPTVAIKELSGQALAAMAQMWLDDLYKKAGKSCPFEIPDNRIIE